MRTQQNILSLGFKPETHTLWTLIFMGLWVLGNKKQTEKENY